MPNYAELIEKQKQYHKAQLEALSSVNLAALEAEKQKHFDAIAEIDEKIGSALKAAGITGKRGKPKKVDTSAIGYERLVELFREHKTKELNLRALKLDTKQVKRLVAEYPGKLELGGQGAWPTVIRK